MVSMSAGRVYDRIGDTAVGVVRYVLPLGVLCELVLEKAEDDENLTELEEAGLDQEELEFMDDDERREILEVAGLDPDDFDF